MDKKEIEIPFGAFDSELMHQEINIPEGFEAEIKGDKIILTKTDSEDEKVRKELITHCRNTRCVTEEGAEKIAKWIAFLEKQGTPNQTSIWKHWKDGICGNGEGEPIYLIKVGNTYSLSSCLGFECDYIELSELDKLLSEKQSEQKPANKVEPKFHEGEWVVFNNRHDSVYQVEKIENYEYTLRHFLGGSMPLSFSHEDMIRAWTVKDVRDGDVLTDGDYPCLFKSINEGNGMFVYCGINGCRNFVTKADGEDNILWDDEPENYCPATKEQRDTLFAKMKEAGYEWDIEKKELKKIEDEEYNGEDYGIDGLWHAMNILEKTLGKVSGYQTDDGFLSHQCAITAVKKLCKQKASKWSEEDENRINHLIAYLEDKELFTAKDDIVYANWLKSLKPQNTWKPTDLQLDCLSDAIERYNSEGYPADVLKTLLRQLKKIG